MRSAFILVDNLRIGGFQRLALDQAYEFSKRGYSVQLIVMDDLPDLKTPSFTHLEYQIITDANIDLKPVGKSRLGQLRSLKDSLSELSTADVLLSHSLRATFLLFLAFKLSGKGNSTITTIHQLPSLSRPKQRFQRFLYAQFTSYLLAYSEAVKLDWQNRFNNNWLLGRLFHCKEIQVLRNGVFLDRLPRQLSPSSEVGTPRLVYLGRNTSWKGVSTFLSVAAHSSLENFEILFLVPRLEDLDQASFPEEIRDRISIIAGKSISSYSPRRGDVHLYPANYGPGATSIESVSLNCLELACLGIPTILTVGGLLTWPDLIDCGIFFETDWKEASEVANLVKQVSCTHYSSEVVNKLRGLICISNQVTNLERIKH